MIFGATLALIVAAIMILFRLLMGPTLYDRVLAVNSFGSKTVLLLAIMGFVTERPEWLDIAIAYALINFVGTIAILKFFRYRSFQTPMTSQHPETTQGALSDPVELERSR